MIRRVATAPEQEASHFDALPALCDVIDGDGRLVVCNRAQASAVGRTAAELAGRDLREIYARSSVELLEAELARAADGDLGEAEVTLHLRQRDMGLLALHARVRRAQAPDGTPLLHTAKLPVPGAGVEIGHLRRDIDVLRGILEASRDACWCIEYEEPVDLSAPEHEVLRQFFENVSYWRLCNEAMARLYKLPAGLDFNEQSVRFHFPRSPANEEFVRQLMRAGFNLDNAPSVDIRHDGTVMHAENDVRADIRDARLHRMWGLVRDVSAFKQAEQALVREVDAMVEVLTALPDPVLVIGTDGLVEAANPALGRALGWRLDALLGAPIDALVRLDGGFERLARAARRSGGSTCATLEVDAADGTCLDAEMHLAAIGGTAGDGRTVATLHLRPRQSRMVAS